MPQINETILIFYFFAELHLFFPLFGEKNNSRGNQEECEGRAMGPEAVRRAERWCGGGWGEVGCAGGEVLSLCPDMAIKLMRFMVYLVGVGGYYKLTL